jgi:hypothetical protein
VGLQVSNRKKWLEQNKEEHVITLRILVLAWKLGTDNHRNFERVFVLVSHEHVCLAL